MIDLNKYVFTFVYSRVHLTVVQGCLYMNSKTPGNVVATWKCSFETTHQIIALPGLLQLLQSQNAHYKRLVTRESKIELMTSHLRFGIVI